MLLKMGQRAEALMAWEHCLTLNPHFHPARREMEKVRGRYHGGEMLLSSEGLVSISIVLLWTARSSEVRLWSKSLPIAPMQVHP